MPLPRKATIFAPADVPPAGELFETLLTRGNVTIERIISSGHQAPQRFLQEQDEWVLLLTGTAQIKVEQETLELAAGDYLFLPSQTPHEVLATSENAHWLAVHLKPRTSDSLAET